MAWTWRVPDMMEGQSAHRECAYASVSAEPGQEMTRLANYAFKLPARADVRGAFLTACGARRSLTLIRYAPPLVARNARPFAGVAGPHATSVPRLAACLLRLQLDLA